MMQAVDWRALADRLGTITWSEHGRSEHGGTQVARDAIAEILGASAFREAVDFYLSGAPGHEVARSVLMLLKPPAAMDRCREIFRAPSDEQEAAEAINLLAMIADSRVLAWIPEFMASENVGVRVQSLEILDQLLVMQESISPEEATPFFKQALADPSQNVRDQASCFLDALAECEPVKAMRSLM